MIRNPSRHLLSLSLALIAGTACVDTETVASTTSAIETEPGSYLVANAFVGLARFHIEVTIETTTGPKTNALECKLDMGESDASARCPNLATLPVQLVDNDNEPMGQVIRVGFAPLASALTARGYSVLALTAADEDPEYHPAEAEWSWGSWDCVASQADIDTCNNSICAGHGGGSVTVDEIGPSNNLFLEPSCEVTCTCNDGTVGDIWVDPPQVEAAW